MFDDVECSRVVLDWGYVGPGMGTIDDVDTRFRYEIKDVMCDATR
jgi:hypothetical protein